MYMSSSSDETSIEADEKTCAGSRMPLMTHLCAAPQR